MKTGTHDHESPRELPRQTEAQRKLAPKSEQNVCRHKCNLKKSRLLTAQDTQQKLGLRSRTSNAFTIGRTYKRIEK